MRYPKSPVLMLLTLSAGLLIGLLVGSGFTRPSPPATTQTEALAATVRTFAQALDQQMTRLADLEKALTALMEVRPPTTSPASATAGDRTVSNLDTPTLRHVMTQLLRQEVTQPLRQEFHALETAVESLHPMVRILEPAKDQVLPTDTAEGVIVTPESQQFYDQSYDLVQNALEAGRWTDEDVNELRQTFRYLTEAQQKEILQPLKAAMQKGEIIVETSGPPF